MERIFAIYDSDVLYATRLMEYFNKKTIPGFDPFVFTRKEKLEAFLSDHKIEILLMEEQLTFPDEVLNNIKNIFYFIENRAYLNETEEKFIRKYQPAQKMISEVLGKYHHKETKSQTGGKLERNKIITIFSPKPGAETSFYAWSLGIRLSKLDKTLFIPMELFDIPGLPIQKQTGFYLSEFIFYLKENPVQIEKIKDMLQYEGYLSYLAGIMHGCDLLSLTREDIHRMIELFSRLTNFNTIVIYTAFYSEAVIELMNISDSVHIPVMDSAYEEAILHEWERQMERTGINMNTKKFSKVFLPVIKGQDDISFNLQTLADNPFWKASENFQTEGIWEAPCSN